jgi:SPP1 family predicted phage head-tail adaptor
MKAGKLDRRIRLETKSATLDTYGQETVTWNLLAEVWAEVLPTTGRELVASLQVTPEVMTKFRIRWITGFKESDRIVYQNEPYDIVHIAEMGRREGLEIMAKKPFRLP